jgi:hypothetical protein
LPRFFAGVAVCILLMTGAFLAVARGARAERMRSALGRSLRFRRSAPSSSAKTREEKRFSCYDKNKDGKVQTDEYLAARHRNFDKLGADHNGALSFQEYAVKGIEKFDVAGGRKGWLSAA